MAFVNRGIDLFVENRLCKLQCQSVKALDHLRYHYYAGYCYCVWKNWPKALEFFTIVLTTPTEIVSMVQVDAYLKYILVSLIGYNKLVDLPSFTSPAFTRVQRKIAMDYLDLAQAFTDNDLKKLDDLITTKSQLFLKQKNFGLVRQVRVAFQQKRVLNLTDVFTKLPIQVAAEQCGWRDFHGSNDKDCAKFRDFVAEMITSNKITASISDNGMEVSFGDSKLVGSTTDIMRNVMGKVQEVTRAKEELAAVEDSVRRDDQLIRVQLVEDGGLNVSAPLINDGGIGISQIELENQKNLLAQYGV